MTIIYFPLRVTISLEYYYHTCKTTRIIKITFTYAQYLYEMKILNAIRRYMALKSLPRHTHQ